MTDFLDTATPPTPCEPYPDNAEIKSVGLGACPKCNSWACYRQYREWADKAGVRTQPRPGLAIAEVAIDLERGQNVVTLKLMSPGIIRAAGFWEKSPSVIGATSMRAVQKMLMPLLFVECDPAGTMQDRVLLFLPSNVPFAPRDGFRAEHRATAIGQAGALHVYEIVAVRS